MSAPDPDAEREVDLELPERADPALVAARGRPRRRHHHRPPDLPRWATGLAREHDGLPRPAALAHRLGTDSERRDEPLGGWGDHPQRGEPPEGCARGGHAGLEATRSRVLAS